LLRNDILDNNDIDLNESDDAQSQEHRLKVRPPTPPILIDCQGDNVPVFNDLEMYRLFQARNNDLGHESEDVNWEELADIVDGTKKFCGD
jgi:hypothetical protein